MKSIADMVREQEERRQRDAQRFAEMDSDLCMFCGACGPDKRSLYISCLYAIYEVVPEAIDLSAVEDEALRNRGYYLLICKSCRGRLLGMLKEWRDLGVGLRDCPKDHDGCIEEDDPARNIPVRVNGAVVMMTADEYMEGGSDG